MSFSLHNSANKTGFEKAWKELRNMVVDRLFPPSKMMLLQVASFSKKSTCIQSPRRSFSTTKDYQFVKVATSNEHAVSVTLSRSEIHNAFNEVLIEELTEIFTSLTKKYPNARVAVLTGTGNTFSAGADLNWMKKMATYTKEQNLQDSRQLFDMFYSIRNCSIPVVGRINGSGLGGGAGLVSVCDMAFAISGAKFGFTEVKLGLVPAVISPFVMEKIGKSNSSRLFLTGERFGAEEAKRYGLIQDHFGTEAELDQAVQKVIGEIVASGPAAVKLCKQLIKNVAGMDMHQSSTKDYVTKVIAEARVSSEGQAGLSAFLKKEKPAWQM